MADPRQAYLISLTERMAQEERNDRDLPSALREAADLLVAEGRLRVAIDLRRAALLLQSSGLPADRAKSSAG